MPILFIIFPFSDSKNEEAQYTFNSLEEILQSMDGVGKVSLYIHYDSPPQQQNDLFGGYFDVSTQQQVITGVLLVAEGASDERIKRKLINTLSSLLQISAHRITVVPMKEEHIE